MTKQNFLITILVMFFINVAAQNSCEQLLESGLYSKINITSRTSFNQDIRTYFLSEDFKRDMRSGSWGGSLSIPIDGVPFSIGANSSDDEFTEFKSKIESATSLNISINDFISITKELPNTSLYEAYVKCKEIENTNRTGLVPGKKIETEETVIFTFFYRPTSHKKAPRVKSFTVTPPNALIDAGGIKKGKRLPSFLMQVTCRRSEVNEVTLSLQTDEGYFNDNSGPSKSSKFETPVGTIIASTLSFDRFKETTGENIVWKTSSKWAPCDGREVTGSAYAKHSGSSRVPDLRGIFLRGLNNFDLNPPGTVQPVSSQQKDPENRTVGSFQLDNIKNHSHQIQYYRSRTNSSNGGGHNHEVTDGETLTSTTTQSCTTCGEETRPKNIAVYYYIKIN